MGSGCTVPRHITCTLCCVFSVPKSISFHHHSTPPSPPQPLPIPVPLAISTLLFMSMSICYALNHSNPTLSPQTTTPLTAVSLSSIYESVCILLVSSFCFTQWSTVIKNKTQQNKNRKILPFVTAWMYLKRKSIMLSELNQSKTYCY